MSNIFKPGDKVAILYPYPADNPKPHTHFKHGEPLVVIAVGKYGRTVYCRKLNETEETGRPVRTDRLNFYGVVEKEACKVKEDIPACEHTNAEYEPFDYVKSQSGSYDTYYFNIDTKTYLKVDAVKATMDGLYVIKIGKQHKIISKFEIGLKQIERKFYANVYADRFGEPLQTLHATRFAALPGSMGIIEISYSNGKLISVNIVK